jgi:hypothetical protein
MVSVLYFQANGDVIMPGYHPVQRCAFISNLSQFPDIVLVAAYQPAMSPLTFERYVIKEDSCLIKGYKFCPFYMFWAEKSYFDSTGLSKLPIDQYINNKSSQIQDPNVSSQPFSRINVSVDPYGGQVPDSAKYGSESLEYKMVPTTDGKAYTLYLASKTLHYTSGSDITEKYSFNVLSSNRKFGRNNSREVVRATFGQGCLHLLFLHGGLINAQLIDCRGCIINKFSRNTEPDMYYTIPCTGLKSGMYWLRVKSIDKEITLQVKKL